MYISQFGETEGQGGSVICPKSVYNVSGKAELRLRCDGIHSTDFDLRRHPLFEWTPQESRRSRSSQWRRCWKSCGPSWSGPKGSWKRRGRRRGSGSFRWAWRGNGRGLGHGLAERPMMHSHPTGPKFWLFHRAGVRARMASSWMC